MIIISSVTGMLVSFVGLLLLAKSDQSRHPDNNKFPLSANKRKLLVGLVVIPLLFYVALGQITSLLVWIGGISVLGWLIALIPKRWV